jgi:hypothetical protein
MVEDEISRKEDDSYYVLFPFHNLIGWKKKGYNGSKIRRYAIYSKLTTRGTKCSG